MATTDIFGWRYPELGVDPDGPDAIKDLAEDIETTYSSEGYVSFTPQLVAGAGAVPFTNSNGSAVGRYRVWQGWCDLVAFIRFGSAVNGGTGQLRFALPLRAAPSNNPPSQWMVCRLWTPSHGHWQGQLYIPSDTSMMGYPYFPITAGQTNCAQLQNANSSGTAGTGIPTMGGLKTIQSTGLFTVNGRYRVV